MESSSSAGNPTSHTPPISGQFQLPISEISQYKNHHGALGTSLGTRKLNNSLARDKGIYVCGVLLGTWVRFDGVFNYDVFRVAAQREANNEVSELFAAVFQIPREFNLASESSHSA